MHAQHPGRLTLVAPSPLQGGGNELASVVVQVEIFTACRRQGHVVLQGLRELDAMEDYTAANIEATIARLEAEMRVAAKALEFERAAELRDRVKYLRDRELTLT